MCGGHLTKEDTQITNKTYERCSTSSVIRELQIKKRERDTMTHLLEKPKSKTPKTPKAG